MNDQEWMEMRAEASRMMKDIHKELIEEWCKECHVTSPVGYHNDHRGVMTIYTDKPGYLIGRGGEKVNKFKEALKREFHREYKVVFVEVRGGFVNNNKEYI